MEVMSHTSLNIRYDKIFDRMSYFNLKMTLSGKKQHTSVCFNMLGQCSVHPFGLNSIKGTSEAMLR